MPPSPLPSGVQLNHLRRFRSHGVRFSVETRRCQVPPEFLYSRMPGLEEDRSGEVDDLRYRLDYLPRGAGSRGACYRLYENGVPLARGTALSGVLEEWESTLQNAVAARSPDYVFVHAAVLGRAGCALLLPGRTHSGKSTLTVQLARAGWDYYSDEFAVLDAHGAVHAYPRPAKLRDGKGQLAARIAASGLRGVDGPFPPLRPALVISTEYRKGAAWQTRSLTPAETTLELLQHTVGVRLRSAASLNAAALVARSALGFRAVRGEASEAVQQISELVTAHGIS